MLYQIEAKESIRKLVLMHQELMFSGGVSPNSDFYLDFVKLQHKVLAMFNLPPTNYHKSLSTSYPFSCKMTKRMVAIERVAELTDFYGLYFLNGIILMGFPNDNLGFSSQIEKVEWVFFRLSQRAEEYHKKGRI
jgi:hypothetical protein